jgi:UDPglucose 6-dehydrogenase
VGYGGSCFPKDVSALFKTSQQNNYEFRILDAVMTVNEMQKGILVEKIINRYGSDLSGFKFAVWGLAFKPNTDDIREAPALVIIKRLQDMGAEIIAFDPEAIPSVKEHTDLELNYADGQYDGLQDADALIIVTEWNEFRTPNFDKIKGSLKSPVIFDGRNVYDLEVMEELGFDYYSIGRKTVLASQKISK